MSENDIPNGPGRSRGDDDSVDASKAQECFNRARDLATRFHHEYWSTEHLLLSLLADQSVTRALIDTNGEHEIASLAVDLENYFRSSVPSISGGARPKKTEGIDKVARRAATNVETSGRKKVTGIDVLIALWKEKDSPAVAMLKSNGFDIDDIKEYAERVEDAEALGEEVGGESSLDQPAHERVLRKYCTLLNEKVKKSTIDPLIGRAKEVEQLTLTLARRYKKNAILTGHPGVGKTAICEGLAHKINEGDVPEFLKNGEVWSLDITAIVAGAKFRGDMEERLKNIIKALGKVENPILFIDEIHMLMGAGAGSNSAMDMANILKPSLARGDFRCIGATTDDEYREYFEKDKALVRRFKKIKVEEPSIEDAKKIMHGLATSYEEHHGVKFTPEAIDAMVDLSARYISNRYLPDKAIDVMDIAGARQKIVASITGESREITVTDIQDEVAEISMVPSVSIKEDETDQLMHLEDDLKRSVFDQDEAVVALTNAIMLSRSGLRSPSKTLGNYLFAGPTGTGKTEVCKQLSKTLAIELVKFNMSEYSEAHSISKLIGSPPGYVGFGDGQAGSGLLINAIEENPHCILLLDEIEKAHPDIYNLFLQIMEEGEVSSAAGKTVNCKNIIVIMTSNVGASSASKDAIGFGRTTRVGEITKAIETTFTPEFRNRLDAIVEFKPLTRSTMEKIVDKFIQDLNVLSSEKKVTIILDEKARELIADEGYDPKLGARPLSRVIDNRIKLPLSKRILFGDLKDGGVVHVSAKDKEITFKVNKAKESKKQETV